MKRTLTITIALMLTLTVAAQENVTHFMGIPVDGTKADMTEKLMKAGIVRKGNDLVMETWTGNPYLIRLMTNKGRMYRVSMIETKGTGDVDRIIGRFEALVDEYREATTMYCEYEYNHPVVADSEETKKNYIQQGCYYAEFFQVADPQLYSRRVAFRITDEYGDYRIERLYDNIYNMPEGK